ncbi:DUF4301 family protein [Aquirufa sp.]|jgi:hypothetical protein|uniref:DUF4301 family protein n=1 Tax=Aquirufa sp. TaxID=2676249 RepID=UPI0037BF6501
MLTANDLLQLSSRGIRPEEVNQQVEYFKQGFPWMNLEKSATVGDGIVRFSKEDLAGHIGRFESRRSSLKLLKMVPASGAATRMFKSLFEYIASGEPNKESNLFFSQQESFAFYEELNAISGDSSTEVEVLKHLLGASGMDYGSLPKGLLKFHNYSSGARTPLEEHLVEAAAYASDGKTARLHFTVSPEHRGRFEDLVNQLIPQWSSHFGVDFEVTFSEQKPATDTVAVNMDNTLFREADGSLLFRPAGHGALLENLNDLSADIIFIKNIDNVVPDHLKSVTIEYKKALAGLLLWILEGITYLEMRLRGELKPSLIEEALVEVKTFLGFEASEDFKQLSLEAQATELLKILGRPTRVCGVVKNTGEPGGGPFWCQDAAGNLTLQLVESAQVDMSNASQKALFGEATHFNPVDLVCATRGCDLIEYRDMLTGFITEKTKDGKSLKAQELPGLWNGAMAHWNTLFVEVPLETFNPVKTVTDLLRPAHQNG